MRKVLFGLLITIAIVILVILINDSEIPEPREGVDEQLAIDALNVADTVDRWFNENETMYDELPGGPIETMNDFSSSNYKTDDEEFSEDENEILEKTMILTTNYQLHGTSSDEGVRDLTEEINESIEEVRKLTKEFSTETVEIEREPLPFDKDEYIQRYFEIADDNEEIKDSMKLSVGEESITLTFGTMLEAQILFNTLNEFMQDEMIDQLTDELVTNITEHGNYYADFNTSGLHIVVEALNISSVMVVVASE